MRTKPWRQYYSSARPPPRGLFPGGRQKTCEPAKNMRTPLAGFFSIGLNDMSQNPRTCERSHGGSTTARLDPHPRVSSRAAAKKHANRRKTCEPLSRVFFL